MTEANIFHEALKRSQAERGSFLDSACGGDALLRSRAEELLAAHDVGHIVGATVDFEADSAPSAFGVGGLAVRSGLVIAGRYQLVEPLGEGGMGEVWVAQQSEPVKRRVALKLIKAGMDSKAVLNRFEAERQALALMDHPNIAKVLDGGMTADGRPYFVMELVDGLPLTRFCDEAKLTTKDRLELFVPICQAVQHAHQKGIVHRDLKPSNILVTRVDGRPVPKVIDFGVAKATGGKLTEETLSTGFGAVVGTLEYMSPEQAGFSGVDIDTRADIYSLGVILYELLTGLRPFDAKRLRQAALTEMIRIIQEEEPSKPSTRLSTDEALSSQAALRQTEPRKLMALLRGELDWVVMKCLEKQRERRYESASGLAQDLMRYLADEPVEARPASFGYRASKFLKRNKGPALAASLALFALLAGMAGTTWGLFEAKRQERLARAETSAKELARAAEAEQRAVAEAQKAKAEQAAAAEKTADAQAQKRMVQIEEGSKILASVFTDLDPRAEEKEGRPLRAILGDRLMKAAEQLKDDSVGDPLLVASLQDRLGLSLLSLGMAQRATPLFVKARATRTARLGADHPDTLHSMNNLALGYEFAGKQALALPLLEETLERRKAKLGVDHPDTLMSMSNLATSYQIAGKLDRALALLEETFKRRKATLGADHADTLTSMNNLASGYRGARRLDRALPLYEETLKLKRAKLGADQFDTLITINNLASAYYAAGKLDQALPLFEETFNLKKAKLSVDHPSTLISMNNLAAAYHEAGKLDRALPLYEEALKLRKAKLGADHPDTLQSMNNLADGHKDAGKLDQALPLLQEAAAGMERRRFQHEHADPIVSSLIECHERLKQFDQAEAWRRKWLAAVKEQAGTGSLPYAGALAGLGSTLLRQEKWIDAEAALRASLTLCETKLPDDWRTFNAKSLLGGALLGQKKHAEAEPLLLAGYEGMKKQEAKLPPQGKVRLREALERLVRLHEATGDAAQAAEWRKKLEAPTPPAATAPGEKK